MLKNTTYKQRTIIIVTLTLWSIVFIGSGITMQMMDKPKTKTKTELKITQKRVANMKSNEILLKSMEQEINQPLSMNVKDYLENVDDIDNTILNELKLDTSMVNVNQAGTYTYTVTYQKKTFNGTFEIKEKPLPDMVLTLKNLNLELGSALSTDIQTYITETLTEEVKPNVKLDLTIGKFIIKPILATAIMAVCSYFLYSQLASGIIIEKWATILSILFAILIYLLAVIALKILTKEEIYMLPYGKKIYKVLERLGIYEKEAEEKL